VGIDGEFHNSELKPFPGTNYKAYQYESHTFMYQNNHTVGKIIRHSATHMEIILHITVVRLS